MENIITAYEVVFKRLEGDNYAGGWVKRTELFKDTEFDVDPQERSSQYATIEYGQFGT